jgi:hypothetical protein
MDAANLILNTVVSPAGPPENIQKPDDAPDAQKIILSTVFLDIFLINLLDVIKNNFVKWDDVKDGTSKQMDGIFWMNLADELGGKGGLGLWKDIYKSLDTTENTNTEAGSLNHSA